jgi:hypothetical protein
MYRVLAANDQVRAARSASIRRKPAAARRDRAENQMGHHQAARDDHLQTSHVEATPALAERRPARAQPRLPSGQPWPAHDATGSERQRTGTAKGRRYRPHRPMNLVAPLSDRLGCADTLRTPRAGFCGITRDRAVCKLSELLQVSESPSDERFGDRFLDRIAAE